MIVPASLSVAALLAVTRGAPPVMCVLLGFSSGLASASLIWKLFGTTRRPSGSENEYPTAKVPDRIALLDGLICEIRQPLSSLQGFAELLASPAAADLKEPDLRAYRQMMVETSRALFAFLAEARDFALLEKGNVRLIETDVDAAELVEATVRLSREAAEKADVQLIADLEDQIEVTCDVSRFRQALNLLILRAIRRTPRAGAVRMRLKTAAAGELEFTITDAGPQIASAQASQAFEPDFERMALSAFALPVARRVALLHSGEVTLSNLPDGGTVARLTLPASRLVRATAVKGGSAARAA